MTIAEPVSPLTGGTDIALVQRIDTHLLIDGYRRDFGVDVRADFAGCETIDLLECRETGLQFFSPAIVGGGDLYRALRGQGWYDPARKFEFTCGAAVVQPGDRVLDIGCGAAHFAAYLPGAAYTGYESDPAAGPRAMPVAGDGAGEGASVVTGDLDDVVARHAGGFDVVTAFQVLEHAADPRAFVRQCLRALKPGGTLVLGVPDRDSYLGTLPNFVLNAPPHHVTWWNAQSLKALAGQAPLQDIVLHPAPVEWWEARLYWMARILPRLRRSRGVPFDAYRVTRAATVAAYLAAGIVRRISTPGPDARGATLVLTGRKGA